MNEKLEGKTIIAETSECTLNCILIVDDEDLDMAKEIIKQKVKEFYSDDYDESFELPIYISNALEEANVRFTMPEFTEIYLDDLVGDDDDVDDDDYDDYDNNEPEILSMAIQIDDETSDDGTYDVMVYDEGTNWDLTQSRLPTLEAAMKRKAEIIANNPHIRFTDLGISKSKNG